MLTQTKNKTLETSVEDFFDLGKVDFEDAILVDGNQLNQTSNVLSTDNNFSQAQPQFGYSLNQPNAAFYKKVGIKIK